MCTVFMPPISIISSQYSWNEDRSTDLTRAGMEAVIYTEKHKTEAIEMRSGSADMIRLSYCRDN